MPQMIKLKWVHQALLDELIIDLQQAKALVDNYAEGVNNAPSLMNSLKRIHDVAKVSRLMPIQLVLSEMLAVLVSEPQLNVAQRKDVPDILARTLLAVENYLLRLRESLDVSILGFFSTLNDLRALRERPLYSEGALLLPDFSIPDGSSVVELDGQLQLQAIKLRPHFLHHFVAWLKKPEQEPLLQIIKVLSQLQRHAQLPGSRLIWLICRAFVEAVHVNQWHSPAIVAQLTDIERWISVVAKNSEEALSSEVKQHRLKNLLYYIAKSPIETKITRLVIKKFKLSQFGQVDADLQSGQLFSTDSLNAVRETLRNEIQQTIDFIDRFLLREEKGPALYPVTLTLQRIGDCLIVLEATEAVQLQAKIAESIAHLCVQRTPIQSDKLGSVAAELLKLQQQCESLVEQRLNRYLSHDPSQEKPHPLLELPSQERVSLLNAVSGQLLKPLNRLRDATLAYQEHAVDDVAIADAIKGLEENQGVLHIMQLPMVADLMQSLREQAANDILSHRELESTQIHQIALQVVALELYLQELARGDLLANHYLEIVKSASEDYANESNESAESADGTAFLETETHVLDDTQANYAVLKEEVDPDLLSVFISEALEQFTEIGLLLPKLAKHRSDPKIMRQLRRSYHTLKGSGRMVGAELLAEFCLTQETLLSQVLARGDVINDDQFRLLGEGHGVLPQLIEQLDGIKEDIVDLDELMSRARLVAVSNEDVLDEDENLINDPELCAVFCTESAGHMMQIRQMLSSYPKGQVLSRVDQALLHELHTLHGSAGAAGIRSISQLTEPLLGIIRWHFDNAAEVSLEDRALLERTLSAIDSVLPAVGQGLDDTSVSELLADKLASRAKTVLLAISEQFESDDNQLQQIFISESEDLLAQAQQAYEEWALSPTASEPQMLMRRVLHTFKGSALMADQRNLADLAHAMESSLDDWLIQGESNSHYLRAFQDALDALSHNLEVLRRGQSITRFDSIIDTLSKAAKQQLDQLSSVESTQLEVGTSSTFALPGAFDSDSETLADKTWIEQTLSLSTDDTENFTVIESGIEPKDATAIASDTVSVKNAAMIKKDTQVLSTSEPMPTVVEGTSSDVIKVNSSTLDHLVRYAAENNVFRVRAMQKSNECEAALDELQQTVRRLREQLRQLDQESEMMIRSGFRDRDIGGNSQGISAFDPLELDRYSSMQEISRSAQESLSDMDNLGEVLQKYSRDLTGLLNDQSESGGGLQDGLMRLRMQPFENLQSRLERVARQAAQSLGKSIEIDYQGGQLELDRMVLSRIAKALEHLIRNAISHGIESPEKRRKGTKSEAGLIRINAEAMRGEVRITIEDDGSGIDLAKVRKKARELGFIKPRQRLTDEDLLRYVFRPGFSTAKETTELYGRGVGLDVVDKELKQLGGSISVTTVAKEGTRFVLRLPQSLAINEALLVQVMGRSFAIPVNVLIGVVHLPFEQVNNLNLQTSAVLDYAGEHYDYMTLSRLLRLETSAEQQVSEATPVLLLRVNDKPLALAVDTMLGRREIVVKSAGAQLQQLQGYIGAAIMADGKVVLVLDVGQLMETFSMSYRELDEEMTQTVVYDNRALVLVVDDSITIRKFTGRMLERHGYQVMVAKDGIEALALIRQRRPDVMLMDLEMPRMDGFELLSKIRKDALLNHIPVVVITSRTGVKHHQRASALGVKHYLGKPYQESELLLHINSVMNQSNHYAT